MRRTSLISALIALRRIDGGDRPGGARQMAEASRARSRLHGSVSFPGATGQAVLEDLFGSERELADRGRSTCAPCAGKHVNVFVNGTKMDEPARVAAWARSTSSATPQRGQTVPRITNGSTVRVRTLGGTLIASGSF